MSLTEFALTAVAALALMFPAAIATPAQAATSPIRCPSGYHFSRADGACVSTRAPTCSNRAVYDAGSKRCVSYRRPVCPGGYRLVSGGACAPISSGGPPRPPGSSPASVPPTCPSGFVLSRPGQCRSTPGMLPDCPSGYNFRASSGQCVATRAAICPSGYRLDALHNVCTTGAVAQ